MSRVDSSPVGKSRPRLVGPGIVRNTRRLMLSAMLIAAPWVVAQSGGGYDLHWNTQNDGGAEMSGANGYSLTGTVAQPEANPAGPQNGANNYALRAGFWEGAHENDVIFRNGFE